MSHNVNTFLYGVKCDRKSNKDTGRMGGHIARTAGDSDTAFPNNLGQLTAFLQLCSLFSASLFQDIKYRHIRAGCFRGVYWGLIPTDFRQRPHCHSLWSKLRKLWDTLMKPHHSLKNPGIRNTSKTQVPKYSLRLDIGNILQTDANLLCWVLSFLEAVVRTVFRLN